MAYANNNNINTIIIYLHANWSNNNNSIRVYLRANLTAQRPITKLAQIYRNTQK
jgi:hypothetical protein